MASVTIIGVGHVGCALAFDLTERGFDVVLRTAGGHAGNSRKIAANDNYVEAIGVLSGKTKVKIIQGLGDGSDVARPFIIVTVPSQGHDEVLGELSRFDLSQSTVIFITGNGIAPRANNILNAKIIADTSTSPYACKLNAEGVINIKSFKRRLQIGALPADLDEADRRAIGGLFRMPLEWSPTLLDVFFSGVNGVVHVSTALLNLGWTEATDGDFYFYRQGMSSGVCSIMDAVDKERLAVAAAYCCPVKSALDTFNTNYGMNEKTMRDFANKTDAHNKAKGAQKRYLDQDVPYWLVLCSDLGNRAGVRTPFTDVLILLASQFKGVDYRLTGRTLKSLGLGGASMAEIVKAFRGVKADAHAHQSYAGELVDSRNPLVGMGVGVGVGVGM